MKRQLKYVLLSFLVIVISASVLISSHASENPKILFDEGHNEWITTESAQTLVSELERNGFAVESTGWKITNYDMLSGYDVFVIGNAWSDFGNAELNAIQKYFNRGGGILLLGLGWSWEDNHPGEAYPMNEVGQLFDASFNSDIIMDPTNNTTGKGSAIFHTPFIDSSHPVTSDVMRIGAHNINHGSINVSTDWETLITGDNNSYGGYRSSPYPRGSNPPVLAVKKAYEMGGRVAVLSSEEYLHDNHIDEFDNKILALSLIWWLAG